MKRYIVSGLIMLALSMACEEKKKVRRVAAPEVQLTEVTSSPEINLPTVATHEARSTEEPETESEKISLSAKTAPIQYEDVASKVLAEGSVNEIKDEGLERIREKALARARELEAEEVAIAKVEPSTENQDSEEASLPAAKVDAKEVRPDLEAKFQKALVLVSLLKVEQAKNAFLNLCQAGHAHACHKFAWYEEKAGNKANASRFYQAACNNGLGKSCNNLAFQFEQKRSYAEAIALYTRGCDEKHEASCDNLERITNEQARRNR